MDGIVELSRLQFALTAMFHFMFVPLTLGLTWILVIMESLYVVTKNILYKDMTKFWGKLFGINFAIGVTTGLTMEFQFGTNWAYYSHYVGDIFGVPLAIEGLMAFFLESTFIGLFFFAWDRVSRKQHLLITILVAIGSNLSALWILIANGWMNAPVGAHFNPLTMRMELTSFKSLVLNPYGLCKFLHTICAGYVTACIFVLAISSYYLLKKRDMDFAKASFKIASIFGLIAVVALIIIGDNSGLLVYKNQPSKLVALEGIWHKEQAPFGISLFAWPDQKTHSNLFDIQIPKLGSIILTHSLTQSINGMDELIEENKQKIIKGQHALSLLEQIRLNPSNTNLINELEQEQKYLGYGLLLKKYTSNVQAATQEMINQAANDTIPKSLPLFYTFRMMVFIAFSTFLLFIISNIYTFKNQLNNNTTNWLFRWALIWLPMPWIASWCGWFVAEYGRQPWTIYEILPTFLSTSSLSSVNLKISLVGFIVLYTMLALIELWLMLKYARLGPSSLHTGRYHFEK